MKKAIIFVMCLLCVFLTVSLFGCDGKTEDTNNDNPNSEQSLDEKEEPVLDETNNEKSDRLYLKEAIDILSYENEQIYKMGKDLSDCAGTLEYDDEKVVNVLINNKTVIKTLMENDENLGEIVQKLKGGEYEEKLNKACDSYKIFYETLTVDFIDVGFKKFKDLLEERNKNLQICIIDLKLMCIE